ncbi:MAG TPA: eL32 family ribosomal protein, partial [Thermoplasmata archaeon]|nr:eL32 family ribosomal protein [Thermoplasmata archaeon]
MADDKPTPKPAAPAPSRRSKAAPRKDRSPSESKESAAAPSTSAEERKATPKGKAEPEVRIPKRASIPASRAAHLRLRKVLDGRRPIFGRQAANRYWRIGRDLSWRRPRGVQSKQRRHYGYRAKIVRVG